MLRQIDLKKKLAIILLSLMLAGCAGISLSGRKEDKAQTLILATTTSLQDTGLLDKLIEKFEKRNSYKVRTIAVGSGEALAMGRRGEADVLLVHSPEEEKQFMARGYGFERITFMHNWFVVVGPRNDPARISKEETIVEAFGKIKRSKSFFVSRGDQSGTHWKELQLWMKTGAEPSGSWYMESGQGMGETLRISDQRNAYTLADEATFLSLAPTLSLKIFETSDRMENEYSLIIVKPRAPLQTNRKAAKAFAQFITKEEGRSIIKGFGKQQHGKPLFYFTK